MHYSDLWHMNTAGWSVQPDEQSIAFVPCDIDAALTISGFYREVGNGTIEELVQMAQKGAPVEIERKPVTCGDFIGFCAEYDEESEDEENYVRIWWLFSGHVHLYITYNCTANHAGQHRDVVDWMLGTLRDKTKDISLIDEGQL